MFTHITAFGPFVIIFHDVLQIAVRGSNFQTTKTSSLVAYTNFLSIASCRIVNVRSRNDLLSYRDTRCKIRQLGYAL